MTWNEFYKTIAEGNLTEEAIEMAKGKVAKTAAADADKQAEKDKIIEAVTADPKTAQELAAEIGFSWQKISTTLTLAIKGGANIVKGKNDDGKVTYAIA